MKLKSKKDYPFVVECENSKQTNIVLNYYHNDDENWSHWKYVLINSKLNKDIFDTKKFIDDIGEINVISFEEWSNLPEEEIFVLPEKWSIKVTDENKEKLNENKRLIGYKLIKEEYKEAVKAIINRNDWFHNFDMNLAKNGFNFSYYEEIGSINEIIKTSGVLDIWFEPVYEGSKESKIMDFLAEKGIEINEKDAQEIINIVNEK